MKNRERDDRLEFGKLEMSEGFIERNSDKISCVEISMSQELSEGFVWRNLDKIDLVGIFRNSKKYSCKLQEKIIEELIGIDVIAGNLDERYMSDYMMGL